MAVSVNSNPSISVVPSELTVQRDETFTVDIIIYPVGNEIYAAQYDLNFDNEILEATAQTPGSFLSQDGIPTMVIGNVRDNENGFLSYGELRMEQSGVSSPGVLASVTFHVKPEAPLDSTSYLLISNAILLDTNGGPILNLEINSGTVNIPAPPTLTISSPSEGQTVNLSVIGWQASGDLTDADHVILKLDEGTPFNYLLTGSWTFEGVEDGAHVVEAWIADADNNVLPNPEAYDIVNFTVDTTGPEVNIDSPENGLLVNIPELTITGTATDVSGIINEKFEHWYDAQGYDSEESPIGNLDEVTINKQVVLQEGLNIITFTYTDVVYNVGSASVEVTLDTIAPAITDVQNSETKASSVTINWNTDEAADSVVYFGTDQNNLDSSQVNGAYVTEHSVHLEGLISSTTYYYTVSSTDQAGNSIVSEVFEFTTEDAPYITISSPSEGQVVNQSTVEWDAEGDLSGADHIILKLNDGEGVTLPLSGSYEFQVADGAHVVEAWIADADNNVLPNPEAYDIVNFTVDTTGPEVNIDSPENGLLVNTSEMTINGTATDVSGIINEKFEHWYDPQGYDSEESPIGNLDEVTINKQVVLQEGLNIITFTYTDALYNVGNASVEVTLDTIAPAITDVQSCELTDSSVTIVWNTDEPADSLVYYGIDQENLNSSQADNAYVTEHEILLEGLTFNTTYYYTVSSTDQAGNSIVSEIFEFTTADEPEPEEEQHKSKGGSGYGSANVIPKDVKSPAGGLEPVQRETEITPGEQVIPEEETPGPEIESSDETPEEEKTEGLPGFEAIFAFASVVISAVCLRRRMLE